VYSYNVPVAAVGGTTALSHIRLLGRASVAHIALALAAADAICSALAASIGGPP
jgi:hypothetical protein